MNEPRANQETGILQPSSFCQVGIVVKNIDETVKFYEKMVGFGPFEVRDVDYPDATYYGKTAGYRGKRAFFHLGPIQIELIELKDGKTITRSSCGKKGKGCTTSASK
jgi:hypothetical protein